MNQAEISAAIGFKRNTWSNYETGVSKPSYNDLMKIVEYFDISLDKLTSLDLQISHLNKNLGVPKKQDISHLNTHLNTHLNEEDKPYLAVAEDPVAYSSGQNRVVTELLRANQSLLATIEAVIASNSRLTHILDKLEASISAFQKQLNQGK